MEPKVQEVSHDDVWQATAQVLRAQVSEAVWFSTFNDAVAVADEGRDPWLGCARPPAIEDGDLVATGVRCRDEVTADEDRAAEDEEPHRSSDTPSSRRSTSSAVL